MILQTVCSTIAATKQSLAILNDMLPHRPQVQFTTTANFFPCLDLAPNSWKIYSFLTKRKKAQVLHLGQVEFFVLSYVLCFLMGTVCLLRGKAHRKKLMTPMLMLHFELLSYRTASQWSAQHYKATQTPPFILSSVSSFPRLSDLE